MLGSKVLFRSIFAACFVMCITACGGSGKQTVDSAPSARSRSQVVLRDADSHKAVERFCELYKEAADAPTFTAPQLDGALSASGKGWTWYSLWATWCGPCIEELPLLHSFSERLNKAGAPVQVRHISVDSEPQDLAKFRTEHTTAPSGPRLKSQESLEPWLAGFGLDAGASIPIHMFVDPNGGLRCVRVGAVTEPDYGAVSTLLRGE